MCTVLSTEHTSHRVVMYIKIIGTARDTFLVRVGSNYIILLLSSKESLVLENQELGSSVNLGVYAQVNTRYKYN